MDTPVLETKRLRLRPLRIDDADALYSGFSDKRTMYWWSELPHGDVEETRATFARIAEAADADRWHCWAVTRLDNDTAIGWATAGLRRPGVTELGCLLLRAHWGSGIARDAAVCVIDWLFGPGGQRRLFADTDVDNRAACALLISLGFTLEARLRAEWETPLGVRDSAIYGLLRDEWQART